MKLALLALAALVAASPAAAARTRAPAPTAGRLALMPLPKEQLGAIAAGLEIELGSGTTSNTRAADESLDPNDTAMQLNRAGRIVGYELAYHDVAGESIARGRGRYGVQTWVSLYRSAAEADAALTKDVADLTRYRGRYVANGVHLDAAGTFKPYGPGARATGMSETARLGKARVYETDVEFRTGSILAGVSIGRADKRSTRGDARKLARLLARRIVQVQAGHVHGPPEHVPAVARAGRPPAGRTSLAPMCLALGDLPAGTPLTTADYVADDASIAKYACEFASFRIGGSTVAKLTTDVRLYRSPEEGLGSFREIDLLYSSDALAHVLQEQLGSATVVEVRKRLDLGDDALLAIVHATVGGRQVRLIQVLIHVGPVVGSLNIFGLASDLKYADVEPYADLFAKRIEDGL